MIRMVILIIILLAIAAGIGWMVYEYMKPKGDETKYAKTGLGKGIVRLWLKYRMPNEHSGHYFLKWFHSTYVKPDGKQLMNGGSSHSLARDISNLEFSLLDPNFESTIFHEGGGELPAGRYLQLEVKELDEGAVYTRRFRIAIRKGDIYYVYGRPLTDGDSQMVFEPVWKPFTGQ